MSTYQPTTPADPLSLTAAIVAFSAIVPLALLVAPILTTQLMLERGLSASQVGAYFLFELGGISAASLPALLWLGRVPSERVARIAAVLFIIGNLASTASLPLPALLATRLITAMAGGSIMLLCMAAAGVSTRRDRLFGFWLTGQLVLGAAGLALLPALFARFGIAAQFGVMAVLMLLALPLTTRLRVSDRPAAAALAQRLPVSLTTAVMLAIFAFYLGLGGTWAFMSVIAAHSGLSTQTAAEQLAAASLFGIAGAVAATWAAGHLPRRLCLGVGYAGLIGAVLALLLPLSGAGFAASAYAFKFGWTFALPFLLAAAASRDPSGKIMAPVNLMIGTGTSVGPLLAGAILDRFGIAPMLGLSAMLIGGSLILIWLIDMGLLLRPRATLRA
ncbi:MAG: MFS transporter [Proteobacteria bacterium]|nr:MFS transporter [Pseudomonadota bacterium]